MTTNLSEPDTTVHLREAVDALTMPTFTRVFQGDGTTRLEHAPLLVQLEASIHEAMAVTQGDQTAKHTRGVLDADSLFLFTRISSQISDWAYQVKAPHRGTPAETLRAWYVAWSQSVREDSADRFRTKMLRDWAARIRVKLDPADEKTHPSPCPNEDCPQGIDELTGRPIWWDRTTGEARLFPLVISYRRDDGPQMVEKARARCRACGSTWSARELQFELELVATTVAEITNHTDRSTT